MAATCWFCGKREATDDASVQQIVIRPRALTEELREAHVVVPRCEPCRDAHADPAPDSTTWGLMAAWGAGLAGLALFARSLDWSIAAAEPVWAALMSGTAIGFGLGGIVWWAMTARRIDAACKAVGARSMSELSDYPDIIEVLAEDAA